MITTATSNPQNQLPGQFALKDIQQAVREIDISHFHGKQPNEDDDYFNLPNVIEL